MHELHRAYTSVVGLTRRPARRRPPEKAPAPAQLRSASGACGPQRPRPKRVVRVPLSGLEAPTPTLELEMGMVTWRPLALGPPVTASDAAQSGTAPRKARP